MTGDDRRVKTRRSSSEADPLMFAAASVSEMHSWTLSLSVLYVAPRLNTSPHTSQHRGGEWCACVTPVLLQATLHAHMKESFSSHPCLCISQSILSQSLSPVFLFSFFLFCSHIYFLPAKTFSVCLPAEPNKRRTAIKHPCNKQDVPVFFPFFFRNVSLSSTSCLLGCKIMRHYRSWRKAFHISEMSLGFW